MLPSVLLAVVFEANQFHATCVAPLVLISPAVPIVTPSLSKLLTPSANVVSAPVSSLCKCLPTPEILLTKK
jgi:hypothetical protein